MSIRVGEIGKVGFMLKIAGLLSVCAALFFIGCVTSGMADPLDGSDSPEGASDTGGGNDTSNSSGGDSDISVGKDSNSINDSEPSSNGDSDLPVDSDSVSVADSETETEPDIVVCIGEGKKICNDVCVEISQNIDHCGECDNVCPDDTPFCFDGGCTVCENAGELDCGSGCVDVLSNDVSCGSCDKICETGETCSDGVCSSHCLSDWKNTDAWTLYCNDTIQGDYQACISVLDCLLAKECASIDACTSQNGDHEDDCNYKAPGTGWKGPANSAWGAVCP